MADKRLLGEFDPDMTGPAALDREPLLLPDHRKNAVDRIRDAVDR